MLIFLRKGNKLVIRGGGGNWVRRPEERDWDVNRVWGGEGVWRGVGARREIGDGTSGGLGQGKLWRS